jgi:NAD-dependent deacetylase
MSQTPPPIPSGLRWALRAAHHVAALVGRDSTPRDAQTGPWAKYSLKELETLAAFRRNPRLVWEWHLWRHEVTRCAGPDPVHHALIELGKHLPHLSLITLSPGGLRQCLNVHPIMELAGSLGRALCPKEGRTMEVAELRGELPPRCPRCGGLLRPDVVWPGEAPPQPTLEAALDAARTCSLFLLVSVVELTQPAISLPYEAREHNALVVEISTGPTALTSLARYALHGPVDLTLNAIAEAFRYEFH